MAREDLKRLAVSVHRNHGDALEGERVIGVARQISRTQVVQGTSTHRIQEVVLRSNVLCVLDRPFELVQRPLSVGSGPRRP
jgi:hypothetical protein